MGNLRSLGIRRSRLFLAPVNFKLSQIDREFPAGRRTLVLDARRLAGAGDSLIVHHVP